MNLLILPEPDSTWQTQAPGSKFSRTFPYGVFEFTLSNEAQLGEYAVCETLSGNYIPIWYDLNILDVSIPIC